MKTIMDEMSKIQRKVKDEKDGMKEVMNNI